MSFPSNLERWLAALLLAATVAGGPTSAMAAAPDFPEPVADDNGDHAFVREVVPILLGRKPRGAVEIKLLGDIAALEGRDVLVRMLMQRPEFVTHWAAILADDLEVQRGGQRRQSSQCFGPPKRTVDGQPRFDGGNLARFVRNNSPDTDAAAPQGGAGSFNMTDLILSAVQQDDMAVVMRAYLFPFVTNPGRRAGGQLETRLRTALGSNFTHLWVNRQIGCLSCHNESFSTTGPDSGWDRLFAVPVGISASLFGAPDGGATENTYNTFRTDQVAPIDAPNAIVPWGIDETCVTDIFNGGRVGVRPVASSNAAAVAFAGVSGNDKTVLSLEQALREGVAAYAQDGLLLNEPDGSGPPQPADPKAAFAFQVAMTVVDKVWQDVTGERLTIALYFPRNAAQRDALWNLTENVFLAGNWSLKSLLTTILVSQYTNRRAPDSTLHGSDYVLPMILDPWVARDPRLPDSSFDDPDDPKLAHNGQGDLVHRHEPKTLFTSAASALGWPGPLLFGGGTYDAALMRDVGQFWSENEAGTRGVDFASLLAWEAKHGICSKPSSVGTDWIDRLMDAIAVYNAENPYEPLLIRDVVETIKDWLIQEAGIESEAAQDTDIAEIAAVSALFGTGAGGAPLPITTPVTQFGAADLEAKLRSLCGVLLETPQFMLAGLSPRGPLAIPRLRVCNDPDDCDYRAMCERYRVTLQSFHRYIQCLDDDVVPGEAPPSFGRPIDPCLSPRHFARLCTYLDDPRIFCLRDIMTSIPGAVRPIRLDSCRPDVPRCDPRCGLGDLGRFGNIGAAGFGDPFGGGELGMPCCGGVAGGPLDVTDPTTLLAWLEGGRVITADGILIYVRGERLIRPLETGETLKFGDIVAVKPGATFIAEGPAGRLQLRSMPSAAERTTRPIDAALLRAVAAADRLTTRTLLKEGANPAAVDREGMTALTVAARTGDARIVKDLIDQGARLDRPDLRGVTALDTARQHGKSELAEFLVRLGATATGAKPRTAEPPTLVMITGPSARKAPPARGDKYITTTRARDLLVAGKLKTRLPDLDERLGRLKAFGHVGPSITAEEIKALNDALAKSGPKHGVW